MALSIISSKLSGTPGAAGLCQIHEFTPQDVEKLRLRGHLIAVFATSSFETDKDSLSEVVAGRECLTRLHEEYFGNLEKSAFNSLKDSVEKVFNEFKETLENLEIIASVFLDNVIYVAGVAGGQIAIYRNGMYAKIIESKGDSVTAASGYPQAKDTLILGTSSFFREVAYGSLKASLEKTSPESSVELLAPQVHASRFSGRIGAVIIRFEDRNQALSLANVLASRQQVKPQTSKKIGLVSLRNLLPSPRSILGKFRSLLPARKIYVRVSGQEELPQKNKKVTLTVGILLLSLLIISIGFGARAKKEKDYRSSYAADLTKAKHNFEEAINLKDVEPGRSRELFLEGRSIARELIGQGIKDKELLDLQEQINANQGVILGEYNLPSDLFVDLSLLTDDFLGDKLSYSDGELFVLDSKSKKIVSVVAQNKKSKVIAGPSKLGEAKDIASYFGRIFILEDDGIYEVGESRKKVISEDWGDEALIYAYGANLYVLDKSNSQILRFIGSQAGFSAKQNWLTGDVSPDFSKVSSWVINGSVWLIDSDGEILRYNLGNKVGYSPKGIPFEGRAKYIYTNEETESLYLMFPEEKSIVALDKDGGYKVQHISDKIGEARAFVVSEKDKKIIILTDGKLYSIELKHL